MNYQYIRTLLAKFTGGRLLIGFSGGADSTALLLAVIAAAGGNVPPELCAIHFEHGLRGEASLADADFCRRFCAERNIPFQQIGLNVPQCRQKHESVENAARRRRLEAWRELVGEDAEQCAILLAHHADDRRENFFLRLARGSNSSGLTGLRRETRLGTLRIFRPLLDVRKDELIAFLREQGVTKWCEDATNAEDHYRRNFIRLRLLPLLLRHMPFAGGGIDRALDALECDAAYLEESARSAFAAMDCNSAAAWRKLPAALGTRILRYYLERELQRSLIPNHALIARFQELIMLPESPERRLLPLDATDSLELRSDRLSILRHSEKSDELEWDRDENPEIVYDNWLFRCEKISTLPPAAAADEAFFSGDLPRILTLGRPHAGESMLPFGRLMPKKMKKLRTDRKIPADALPPAVRDAARQVVWFPLVRHSALYQVAPEERDIWRMTVVKY